MHTKIKKINKLQKKFSLKLSVLNERIEESFMIASEKVGYQRTSDLENIDCYILNTCHIREKALKKYIMILGV